MKSKLKIIAITIPLLIVLSGCGVTEENLATSFGDGIWSSLNFLMSSAILFLSRILNNNLVFGLVVATIIVRLAILPLYIKQMRSQAEMQKIQPQLKKIQAKYKDKKDPDSVRKLQAEQQALYKDHNVSPLAGCLPTLIQMPILFVFYGAVANLFRYTQDGMTAAEIIDPANDYTKIIPLFGDASDPIIFFGILAGVLAFIPTYINLMGQDPESPGYSSMRAMLFIMPIMMLFISISSPGALAIYFTIGGIFTCVQTLVFRRHKIKEHFDKKKLNKNNK